MKDSKTLNEPPKWPLYRLVDEVGGIFDSNALVIRIVTMHEGRIYQNTKVVSSKYLTNGYFPKEIVHRARETAYKELDKTMDELNPRDKFTGEEVHLIQLALSQVATPPELVRRVVKKMRDER